MFNSELQREVRELRKRVEVLTDKQEALLGFLGIVIKDCGWSHKADFIDLGTGFGSRLGGVSRTVERLEDFVTKVLGYKWAAVAAQEGWVKAAKQKTHGKKNKGKVKA